MSRETAEALAYRVERALVAALFHRPRNIAEASDIVDVHDFADVRHRAVYSALLGAAAELRGAPDAAAPDALAVERALVRASALDLVGGLAGLAELVTAPPEPGGPARRLAELVRDAAEARRLRVSAAGAAEGLARGTLDASEAAEALRADAARTAERVTGDAADAPALVAAFEREAEAAAVAGRGALTPHVDPLVDTVLVPIHAGEMLVVGGRPGTGKSNLAGDLAFGWARAGVRGVVLTAEDAPSLWIAREARKISAADLDIEALRAGRADVRTWTAWHETRAALARLPIWITAVAGRPARDLCARMRRAAVRGARYAVVDYVQLVRPTAPRRGASTSDDITAVVADLLDTAIELGLALVVVSQLRRLAPGAREPRPTMADLRGSGMIEARARAIVLLWRYSAADYSRCKIIRAKWTHGPHAEADLHWLPDRRRFWPLEPAQSRAAPDNVTPIRDGFDEEDE